MKIRILSKLLIIASIVCVAMQCQAFKVGELLYNIISEEEKTVEVSMGLQFSSSPKVYDLVIPPVVEYNGDEYRVVAVKKNGFKGVTRAYNSIEIPSSVKIIGDKAFAGIKNVEEVILHEGLDSIGNDAFGTSSIKKIDFPSTVTKLGSDIFHSSDLQEIEWPKNLHKIPHGCFTFTKLNRFDFTHIKEIGNSAFEHCEFRDNVVIPSGCSILPFAFTGCKGQNLNFEELPQEIPLSRAYQTFLDDYSFCGCLYLKKLILPRGLLINHDAFKSSQTVKTIEIHEGVEFYSHDVFVGDDAYDGHDNFIGYSDNWIPDSIIYLTANPEKTYDIFQEVMYRESTLYVKPEALEKVRNTYPWSKFRKIEVLSSGIGDIPADTDDGQDGPDLLYNLEGIPCGSDRNALPPGIYILRKNGKISKIVI